MVLSTKETTVTYRCPECGSTVSSIVGIFTLTADMIRLKCPCGGSELEIVYTKDKKIRLNVPCFMCPSPHSYLISSSMFFERELFVLPCSYSGMDICFIGKKDKVDEAVKASEKELAEMLGEASFEDLSKNRGEKTELSDPQVLEIVMYVIKDLADEGKVKCNCPDGEGDYTVDIYDDHLTVTCKNCAAHVDVPTTSVIAANDFLASDELILK